jgi:hypothetical protein
MINKHMKIRKVVSRKPLSMKQTSLSSLSKWTFSFCIYVNMNEDYYMSSAICLIHFLFFGEFYVTGHSRGTCWANSCCIWCWLCFRSILHMPSHQLFYFYHFFSLFFKENVHGSQKSLQVKCLLLEKEKGLLLYLGMGQILRSCD